MSRFREQSFSTALFLFPSSHCTFAIADPLQVQNCSFTGSENCSCLRPHSPSFLSNNVFRFPVFRLSTHGITDSAEFCAIEDPEIIPDDTPVVTEEPIAEVIPEIADETVSVIADPGEYVLGSGKKKGQTLNAVYADKDGKSWLDFCLGGQYVKSEVKDAIVAFYASKGLTVDDGDAKFITTAKEYYNANISRFAK